MADDLLRLAAWLSPAFPVGAYTYSHGLEQAVDAGTVNDRKTAERWISDCLRHGAGRNDGILLAHAWRAAAAQDEGAVAELGELATALCPSQERVLETLGQGEAFCQILSDAWDTALASLPYPVGLGAAAAKNGIALDLTLSMFLQAFASNLVSAAVRLVPLGQTEGQCVIARLVPICTSLAGEAEAADIDDLGGIAMLADIASMRHETQQVRLFRS